jgi:hypothetical protein
VAERRVCPPEAYPAPLLGVAGHGLPVAGRPLPAGPLDAEEWAAVLGGAGTHRLVGLLARVVADGAFPVTPAQRAELRATAAHSAVRSLRLERALPGVLGVLEGAGVQPRLLKGAAVARLDYPDPSLRPFGDLDLLVRSADFDTAVTALVDAGFTRPLPEPRPGFDRRFNKGSTLWGPGGVELDLHRTFVFGPWGLRIRLDDLWEDAGDPLVVGGHPVRALSARNRTLHACYHAALGDWPLRLISLRDVAALVLAHPDEAAAVLDRAERWEGGAVVAAAVADAWRLLGIEGTTELVDRARDHRPDRREVRWLALHTSEDETPTAQALHGVRAVEGARARLAYLRAMLLPDPAYFAGRHRSPLARLRHGLVEARRGRGTPAPRTLRRLRAYRALPGRSRTELAQAALLIPAVLACLRLLGVARTAHLLERTSPLRRGAPGTADAGGLARMVGTASAVLPLRSRCLDRSLVTWWLLRRRGLAAVVRIGAGHDEERALRFHAWVEHDGRVVGDPTEDVGRFVPLPVDRIVAPAVFR